MAEHASAVPAKAPGHSYFYLRRLHSLLGLIPVGVFAAFHLTVNATILAGPNQYQAAVNQIHLLHRMGLLIPVEITFIFAPLLFHAVLGVVITLTMSSNVTAYRYGGNVRYLLQRITGVIAFFFIILHLWQMHAVGHWFGGGFFNPENAAPTAAGALQRSSWWIVLYAVGTLSVVYHLANGIWTALITWGITVGPRSQRVAGYVCTAFGICLGLVGMGALFGFSTFNEKAPPPPAHAAVPHEAAAGMIATIDSEPSGMETADGH